MNPYQILERGFDKQIAAAIIGAYQEIERNFSLRKWKPSELDAGHFVEGVRRALELEFTGSYLPFGRSLPPLDDAALKNYERHTGDESYRLLIPRTLKAVYNIRNKRGVAHISNVNPNEMDATFILYTVKWVLAELLRLKSGLSPGDTQSMLDRIVERQCPLVWKEGNIVSVSKPGIKAREQILVLLYDESPRRDSELQQIVEYSNPSKFRRILKDLHREKLIFYHSDGTCRLSPPGMVEAEQIIQKYK